MMNIQEYFNHRYAAAQDDLEIERIASEESSMFEFFLVADPEDFACVMSFYNIDLYAQDSDGSLFLEQWVHDWGC